VRRLISHCKHNARAFVQNGSIKDAMPDHTDAELSEPATGFAYTRF